MIRLVSLNIERSKHLDLVIPFLQAQKADVVCLQELCENDIVRFGSSLKMNSVFAPVGLHPADAPATEPIMIGVGVFFNGHVIAKDVNYYAGSEVDARSTTVRTIIPNNPLVSVELELRKEKYRILVTHFTWTPDGEPSENQRVDLRALLALLERKKEFVLAGDFNAPRGGEIFSALSSAYKDNIPAEYTSSLDKELHRAGDLQRMVDGLFSTPGYVASDVQLHSGVSDHMAVTANIERDKKSSGLYLD